MRPIVKQIQDRVDRGIKDAMENSKVKPPCCRGCFHCCREPVYAQLSEVEAMLETLAPAEIETLKKKTQAWMYKLNASGLQNDYLPSALKYRLLYLWCPFLTDKGECSVYERRPIACRAHIAMESIEGCEKDALRSTQKFATFPGFMEKLNDQRIMALQPGEVEMYDHLGLLLGLLLLDRDEPSASRLEFSRDGNSVTMKRYTDEKEDPASP